MRQGLRRLFEEREVEFFLLCLFNILDAVLALLNPSHPWSTKGFQIVLICILLLFMVKVVFMESLLWAKLALCFHIGAMVISALSSIALSGLWMFVSGDLIRPIILGTEYFLVGVILAGILYRTCMRLEEKNERARW